MRQKNITLIILILAAGVLFGQVRAEPSAFDFAMAVVELESQIKDNGRTRAAFGSSRRGSAIIVDANGLLVTADYLVTEAERVRVTFNSGETRIAHVVTNDRSTGLALLRTALPEGVGPMSLGSSDGIGIGQDLVVLKSGGTHTAHVASVQDIREFTGSREYHINRAIYTAPATREFSGAALLDRDGKLVGIGSLLLSDIFAGVNRQSQNGNLFIPVEYLTTNLGTWLVAGNSMADTRPWLGVSLNESKPDLHVARVATDSPAARAGLKADDKILAINNRRTVSMRELYQSLWSSGDAGATVELLITRSGAIKTITVQTTSRDDWLR